MVILSEIEAINKSNNFAIISIMSTKTWVMVGMTIGSFGGSYLPVVFGVDPFSFTTILTGAVGGIIGVFIGFKLSN